MGLVLGLVALLLGPLAAPALAAQADSDDDAVPAPSAGSPWFGPGLDWTEDLAADYEGRLGTTPSLYAQRVHYPLGDDDQLYLEQFAQQAATQGAVAVVSLEPQVALDELTDDDAELLSGELDRLHDELDTYFLVRFAPEMNGSWVTWGQQPRAYVEAFTVVADAVHAATEHAEMVWSPAYGAGYPFGRAFGAVDPAGSLETDRLDTDDNGVLDGDDDPYGPYYPGDDVVDWVGLSLYRFGEEQEFGNNTTPSPDEFADRLDETWGYPDDASREPFYDRFAEPTEKRMLVETGSLFNPSADPGPGELTIKQEWWRQVFAADETHPLIGAISWLELDREEAEVDGVRVDWGATSTDALADALLADLRAADVDLGPVTRVIDQETGNAATAQGRAPGTDAGGDELGWIVFCAVALAVLFLLAGLAGRWLPSWRYPDEHDPRDRRLDMLRGLIILTVVFTHIELAGPYSFVSLRAIGAITGAEMFVMLSGVVIGMIYAPTVRKLGEWATAVTMWRRARKQYVVSLVVVALVFLLGMLPFVDATAITTFTDRGTGADGVAVQGQVYDLYANAQRLFDYPPPWYAVRAFLLLEMGPWVFNIMGLFVVLSLTIPVLMWLVRRGLWWVLLAVSWGLYVWSSTQEIMVLPSQFEAVFPVLTWQILFTHGLVLGHYRGAITRALVTRAGKIACAAFVVGYAGLLLYVWAGFHAGFTPLPFPDSAYAWLNENGYQRIYLQPGRLVDIPFVIIVAFAVLTTCWRPIDRAVGWLWIPLGQASLYVFIVHVFFVLAVANIPGLDRMSFWQGLVIHTVVALVIWLMVKKKVLFSVIPR